MQIADFLGLVHPAIAVIFVFPIIGIVVNFAWQTRQRRLQNLSGGKSKIPPIVGTEHRKLGEWLTGAVVGVTLIGLAYAIGKNIIKNQLWNKAPFQVIFIILLFISTISCLVFLYQAKQAKWRGILATLTGIGVVVLWCQDGVYRRSNEWYWSHYYIGIGVTLLMIFSLTIIQDIYQDKSQRWRLIHTILNCIALLLFIGQGLTGTRDLLEITLSWQEPFIYQCDFVKQICQTPNSQPQK
ncbi:DUF4079 domain-containing protein [Fortiea contorta]|uniref:DUF4079 domain-containing protein n=1 Tax=Fortiea contorta TaxID=1892405 RepID=UPI0003482E0D|nr:DUF4079 domain-containing protein [Fortiea contorta]